MSIDYEKTDQIALVTMNRPEAMNCLNLDDLDELGRVWTEFAADDETRVAILTGAGDAAFCAGADLKELIPKVSAGELDLSPTIPGFLKNVDCFKPVIAAVNGACLAGGLEMLQGTDIRIAVDRAVFGLPEVQLGLFPSAGSTVRLPRQIPYAWAMQILLLGENISARQALQIGLINRVVAENDLMDTAMAVADRICRNGPVAVQAVKESVIKGQGLPEEQAYYIEAMLAKRVFKSRDAVEGPLAFAQKRAPVFQGK